MKINNPFFKRRNISRIALGALLVFWASCMLPETCFCNYKNNTESCRQQPGNISCGESAFQHGKNGSFIVSDFSDTSFWGKMICENTTAFYEKKIHRHIAGKIFIKKNSCKNSMLSICIISPFSILASNGISLSPKPLEIVTSVSNIKTVILKN
jgi:hypothetical protein